MMSNAVKSKMKMTLKTGETTTTSKTFGNIVSAATDAQLKQAADILGGLQQRPVTKVSRIDEKEITE